MLIKVPLKLSRVRDILNKTYKPVKDRRMLMAVQYNKLFKMMIDRKLTNNQLAKQAGISLNIITRLKRDEYIACLLYTSRNTWSEY